MNRPPDDVQFLVSSDHRVAVLNTLAEGGCDRRRLRDTTGASSPTISRILSDFETRNWVERNDRTYQLTGLGEFVANKLAAFVESMTIEDRIRDVWHLLPHELEGFSVELFTDVEVTYPSPGYPDTAIERRLELISETTRWRGFGVAILGLRTLEASFDRFFDEADEFRCEYVYPVEVFEELLTWNEETVVAAANCDSYTVLLHEELPIDDRFEICLFDDLVTICCYDNERGGLQALIETSSNDMRTWADSFFERFRAEAQPFKAVSEPGEMTSLQ